MSRVEPAQSPTGARASFSLRNRAVRALFALVWTLLAAWTPPPLHRWRCAVLRLFGADIGHRVRLYGSVSIWYPANLVIGDDCVIGPHAQLYNQGTIHIGAGVVISQGAHLCASTHDVTDPFFALLLRPISIADRAWIAAEAFVGPGVNIGEGAVLGARSAAFVDLAAWTIHSGNPAQPLRPRIMRAT